MRFFVEGRYFPTSLQAFTFAQIQADRMGRAVEVHNQNAEEYVTRGITRAPTWHATAHPTNYRRAHLVKQPPGVMASAA